MFSVGGSTKDVSDGYIGEEVEMFTYIKSFKIYIYIQKQIKGTCILIV